MGLKNFFFHTSGSKSVTIKSFGLVSSCCWFCVSSCWCCTPEGTLVYVRKFEKTQIEEHEKIMFGEWIECEESFDHLELIRFTFFFVNFDFSTLVLVSVVLSGSCCSSSSWISVISMTDDWRCNMYWFVMSYEKLLCLKQMKSKIIFKNVKFQDYNLSLFCIWLVWNLNDCNWYLSWTSILFWKKSF